jgi:hypothetical protein
VTSRYGPGKVRQMLRCSTRKARFSGRKGKPPFGARLTSMTATAVLAHVAEGISIGKTGSAHRRAPDVEVRKAYTFSKDWATHRAVPVFRDSSYNSCWPVRTRCVKVERGRWPQRPRRWGPDSRTGCGPCPSGSPTRPGMCSASRSPPAPATGANLHKLVNSHHPGSGARGVFRALPS